jgi:hypothetical protein
MSFVMRIVQDMDAPDLEHLRDSPHVEKWIEDFTCEEGLKSTAKLAKAKRWETREEAREFWLQDCPLGYPWDFIDGHSAGSDLSNLDPGEKSQPLTRYTVMIEHENEAEAARGHG